MEQNSGTSSGNSSGVSRMGLVCHYRFEDNSSQVSILHVDNNSSAFSINHQRCFSAEAQVQIVSSCNGWLLLTSEKENQLGYHVFNPLTREINSLPQPCFSQHAVRYGLVASDKQHFQVVLVHISAGLELEIYSSETREWKRHRPIYLSLPLPVEALFPELPAPPLFSNGAIHWDILGHLLLYNTKTGSCKLIKLPNVPEDDCLPATEVCQQCLWESEGRVHYCYTDIEGVHTWILLNEQDLAAYSNSKHKNNGRKFMWRLADSLAERTFQKKYGQIFQGWSEWKPHDVSPFAYNEASQTMYMRLPGKVISCNTNNRDMEEVCSYAFEGTSYDCCSFFPYVYSEQDNFLTTGEPSESSKTQIVVELPINGVSNPLPI